MSKIIKLPDSLKEWKINDFLSDNKNNEVLKISKSSTGEPALLRHLTVHGDDYSERAVKFLEEEAEFINTIVGLGSKFTYKKVVSEHKPDYKKYDLYIVTEDYTPLSELMKTKSFEEAEVIEFGIQMSAILDVLEDNQIFHGNICPENIFIDESGNYKLGGFTEFETGISDLSYIAPEIANNTPADFTTDIYSVGLIMYSMCNNGKLPFEDTEEKEQATSIRIGGKNITAPALGSEKLKSVIVIACQYKNSNRWKNAGNIRNALTSIQDEINAGTAPDANTDKANIAPVIAAAPTSFDGNMFDDYGFEDESTSEEPAQEETTEENIEESVEDNSIEEISEEAPATEEITSEEAKASEPVKNESKSNIVGAIGFTEIANDVFDNFDVDGADTVSTKPSDTSDYGDFFENDEDKTDESEAQTEEFTSFDNNSFNDNSQPEEKKKGNKGAIIAIILSVIAIVGSLGFVAFCIFNANSAKKDKAEETTAPTTATMATTAPITTVPSTTAPHTTSSGITVTNVIGYGYYYAEQVLNEQGFNVEVGDYVHSTLYDEGLVVSMSPEGDTTAKKGDTITLVVSLGAEEPETEAPTEPETEAPKPESSQNNTPVNNGDDIFPNSSNSYITQAQVNALSEKQLEYAINEIYARNGRIFTSPELASYFASKSWYKPLYTAEEFDKKVTFNTYEQRNLNLLVNARG